MEYGYILLKKHNILNNKKLKNSIFNQDLIKSFTEDEFLKLR